MFNKLDFLSELEGELKFLNKKDRTGYIRYYRQKIDAEIDLGLPEDKIIAKLPTPRTLAASIYRDKGIDYIERQKKRMKVTTVFFLLFSVALMVSITLVTLYVFYYLGSLLINMFTLYPEFLKLPVADAVVSFIFLTIYILLSILFLLLVIELVLYITRALIYKMADALPLSKDFDLERFSFYYWLNRISHKENILVKAFGVLCLMLIGFGIIGYFNKAYIYRVLVNQPKNEEELIVEELGQTDLSIVFDYGEARIGILPTDETQIKITHQYEFNHNFKYSLSEGTMTLSARRTMNYDVFNLLKEPVQYIYIMVPEAYNLVDIRLDINYGEIQIINEKMNNLSLKMISGQLGLEGNQFSTGEVTMTKTVFQSKQNHFQNLNLKFSTGNFKMDNDIGNSLIFNNLYAQGSMTGLNVGNISITNNTGSFLADHMTGDSLDFNTGGGSLDITDYSIKKVTYIGSGIGNIGLTNGISDETVLKNPEGIISMEGLSGKVTVDGGRLNLYSLNQTTGSLDITQTTGSIYVSNDPQTQNRLTSLTVKAGDADLSVEDSLIENIDISLGTSIVTMNEVYGTSAKITVGNGDLNFVNSDKTRLFESVIINITAGSRNVDVGVKK